MSRRPSIIGSLPTSPQESPPQATQPAKPKPAAPEIVHTSLYVPRTAYRKLQEIALAQDRKVHDLILDGIDKVLEGYGHAPTERRKRGPKAS